jgi:alpha-beta hydrolase superfamily lysophospholipase
MPDHCFELPPTPDGQIPVVHGWRAKEPGGGVIILAHGMGEHSLRYESLAESLTAAGFEVYANDHRGHGKTVKNDSQLGDYGPDGWRGLIDDEIRLIRKVREEHAGPILIMGHSMGSMVVQHLLTEASDLLDGAALSGTTAVDVMAAAVAANANAEDPDADLFASFNVAFEPVRTESDWLSRDPEQVDLYVEDPLCGFSVSDTSLESLMEAGVAYSTKEATDQIRKDLPIFLLAGDADPVSLGGELVKKVAERYRDAGIADVTLKLYSGARHEVFNETNRAEVEADFVAWATRVRDAIAQVDAGSVAGKGASQ